ncbi:MAG: hypothetical protein ACLQVX_08955 [Limisphaerales bacterium]
MKRELWERFPAKLKTVEETPEPLCSAALAALKPEDETLLLIFGPAQKILGKISLATLLVILDKEWIVVTGTEEIKTEVFRCAFADTLLVEITKILLYGKLRIDFAAEGRAQTVELQFNTVMEGLYQEAVKFLLNGMDNISEIVPRDSKELCATLKSLPLKFCNAVVEFMPAGQRVLGFVHWPAAWGRKLKIFRRELSPEAVLILTERELLFISEEKTWSWVRPDRIQKYGSIVTHCLLSRVSAVELSEHDSLDTIDVEIRANEAGEKLKIDFPQEQKTKVSAFIELALKQQNVIVVQKGRDKNG